jgi:ubiquinol-cytochrome c reductase iron-sulfur subunit
MLERLTQVKLISELRDPNSATKAQQPDYARNETRSIRPKYLVVVGLCTHLGCVPTLLPPDATRPRDDLWSSGYYCPCHGSRFDFSGRVIKSVPAPTNLVVPPHRFLDPNTLEVGVDHA